MQAARHQVAAVLRGRAVLRGVGVEVGADGAGNDALAFRVALHGAAELFNHADRLVANRQPLGYRVLALEDVHVGAANRRRGDADQRVVGANIGYRLVGQLDAARLDKNGGFHHGGHVSFLATE